jgi:hypothetical protein
VCSSVVECTCSNAVDLSVTNTLDAKSTISFYGTYIGLSCAGTSAHRWFPGNAIALYGVVSNNHGNYSVSLDGADPTTYSGTEATFRPQMLLVSRFQSVAVLTLISILVDGQQSSQWSTPRCSLQRGQWA